MKRALFVLAACTLGCSLEGFASGGAGGAAAGGSGPGGSGGDTPTGGAGGGCAPCSCGPWAEQRVTDGGPATTPVIVADSAGWAIAWRDERDGNGEIYYAHVAPDGTPDVASALRLTNDAADSLAPALAQGADLRAVAFEDTRANSDVYISLLNDNNAVVVPEMLVWGGTGAPKRPALAFSITTGFVLVWEDFRDGGYKLHSGLVDTAGMVISVEHRLTDAMGDATNAALVAASGEHGLAWQDTRDGNAEIYFRRIDPGGVQIGGETRVSNAAGDSTDPTVSASSTRYAISWSDTRDGNPEIYAVLLSAGGAPVAAARRITDDTASSVSPSIVWADDHHALVWQDARTGADAIHFARIDAEGALLPDSGAAITAASATSPSLAWSAGRYAVVWQDDRDGTPAVYFASCAP